MYCTCESATCDYPSARDPYQPAERRIPNPTCPRHARSDDMSPDEYGDPADMIEMFGIAWSYDQAAWVDATGIDDETGEPINDDEEK